MTRVATPRVPSPNVNEIRRALESLVATGDVVELRALDVPDRPGGDYTATHAGFYSDVEALAIEAEKLSKAGASGVYVTLNPVLPELLARAENRVRKIKGKGDKVCTNDKHVKARRWLGVDVDPKRPADISATREEVQAARRRAEEIRAFLTDRGWPEPIEALGGNSIHLLYRVDLPAEDDGLVARVLQALAERFTDEALDVDTKVSNPSRIWKLYGTVARKGDHTAERPHRVAKLLTLPDAVRVVSREHLEGLAPPIESPAKSRAASSSPPSDWLASWLAAKGVKHAEPQAWNGGRRFLLEACPFCGSTDRGAIVGEMPNGAKFFKCQHTSCAGKKWQDLRAKLEPERAQRDQSRETATLAPGKRRVPVILCMEDVKPEPVSWLWAPYVPRGELTLLEGDPKVGKSWIAMGIATAMSRGASLPGDTAARPRGTTLYMTNENSPQKVFRPRLDLLGADPARVRLLEGWRTEDDEATGPVSLQDLALLRDALDVVRPDLLVIDPVQSFLGAGVDAHRAEEVRPVLDGLVKIARDRNLAVLMIRHLAKGQTGRALYRGMGSIDFTACARSILMAGETPEGAGPKRRALVHALCGVGPEGPSQGYTVIPPHGFAWTGESNITTQDLVAPDRQPRSEDTSAGDTAEELLRDLLRDGPRPAREVQKILREAGVSRRTEQRVKERLGVAADQIRSDGKVVAWSWKLPAAQEHGQSARSHGTPGGALGLLASTDEAASSKLERHALEFGALADEEGEAYEH